MKLKNKLEVEETLEVGVIPNATTSNFSVVFETAGLFQRRQVGTIINKNDNEYLPSVSNAFPSSVFVVNASTTHANPNLTVSFVNQVAGSVFAAPQSLNGTPAFRMLQDSDLSQTSLGSKQTQLTNGLHTTLNGNKVDVAFDVNTYVKDKSNNDRLLFGNTSSTDVVIHGAVANGDFKVKDSTGSDMFRMNGSNKVAYFPQLPAAQTGASNNLAIFDSGNGLWKSNVTIGDLALSSQIPTNYITTNTNQTGLTGNKSVNGTWTFNSQINTANHGNSNQWKQAFDWGKGVPVTEINSYIITHTLKDINTWNKGSYIQGTGQTIENRPFNSPAGVISVGVANAGFQIIGDRLSENLAFRGWSNTIDFNDWRTLWHSGNFNPAQYVLQSALNTQLANYVPTSRTITINGVTQNLSANRTWTIPDNDTITRLRGTTSGTFTSGDLTLLSGAGIGVSQSGANFTITNSSPNVQANNGILTIATSSDLTGGGTFSADQATASNVNIGLSAGTLADIALGVTANNWGNHAGLYPLLSGAYANPTWITSLDWAKITNKPNIPPQLVYTGSNGINVTGTVISPTYGTTAGTIAQGDDVRINNGQTAFGWGDFRDYGLGTNAILSGNLDVITETGFYRTSPSTIGSPIVVGSMSVIHSEITSTNATQTAYRSTSTQSWFRIRNNGVWSAWVEFYHSGNFNPAQYVLQSALNTQLANYVPINGVTTINNTKTFTSSPVVPNGTLNGHAVNLGQLNTILDDYATETWVTQQINNISIPTVNDGQLSIATGTGLSGSVNFTANQAGNSSVTIDVANTHKLPTITEWNALPTTNTTYTAGTGLSLTGTTFGQAITTNGTGGFVTGVTQTANGFQVNLGTPPNTVYTAGAGITIASNVITNSAPNVQADWNATSGLAQILNKPVIPAQLVYTGSNGINVAGTVISPTYGTTSNTIAQGNDARFHNAVTLGTANGLSLAGQVLSLGLASASSNGALSSTDWNTFNNKSSQTLTNSTSNLIVSNTVQRAALTGDVTALQNSNATTIANGVVTNAKMANMGIGIKGRNTGTGAPLDLTVAQAQAMLGVSTPNDGTFTVQGTGSLTGTGSTSANATANTSSTLDLTAQAKSDIQKGVTASDSFTSYFDGSDKYYIFHDVKNDGINVTPTAVHTQIGTDNTGGVTVDIQDHTMHGAEIVIQGNNGGITTFTINYGGATNTIDLEHASRRLFWDAEKSIYRLVP